MNFNEGFINKIGKHTGKRWQMNKEAEEGPGRAERKRGEGREHKLENKGGSE